MVSIAQHFEVPDTELQEFCKRWKITRLSAFGSVLREDFSNESDLDVLAEFDESSRRTIFELIRMEEEFTTIVGRPVDFVERTAVEQTPNYLRRREILGSAREFYVTE